MLCINTSHNLIRHRQQTGLPAVPDASPRRGSRSDRRGAPASNREKDRPRTTVQSAPTPVFF